MAHPASRPAPRTPAGLAAQDLTVRGMVTLGVVATGAITLLDLVDGHLGFLFSLGFVLVVVTLALAVDVRDLFPAGMVPPVLLLASLLLLAVLVPSAVSVDGVAADAGLVTRYIATVVHHGLTLVVGQGLALAVIVWRLLRAV